MGAQLVKEVATKTNDVAGDGTTTATVLAQAMVREGMRNVAAGANPMVLKKGIQKAVDVLVEELQAVSKKVETKEAVGLRVIQNVFGVVFALIFCAVFYWLMSKKGNVVTVDAE